jgi:hypothetical protein
MSLGIFDAIAMTSDAHSSRSASVGRRSLVLRWQRWALCAGCWLASLLVGLAQDTVSKEYQIKAAYLYNFAKFVEWPPQSFTNQLAPLVIGVFDPNPFGSELQTIAVSHQINGRAIVIKPVANAAQAAGVHLLFIGATEDDRVAATLVALNGTGVLTVGESDRFAAAGGIIRFVRSDDKVRFQINAAAAEHQGLKISAQLLKLATATHREP